MRLVGIIKLKSGTFVDFVGAVSGARSVVGKYAMRRDYRDGVCS